MAHLDPVVAGCHKDPIAEKAGTRRFCLEALI